MADTEVDYDLRSWTGALLRLRRREGESDAGYRYRRQVLAAQAATHRTFLHNPDDYEESSPPTMPPL